MARYFRNILFGEADFDFVLRGKWFLSYGEPCCRSKLNRSIAIAAERLEPSSICIGRRKDGQKIAKNI